MSAHQVWVKEEPGCFNADQTDIKQEPASDGDAEATGDVPSRFSAGYEIKCEPDITYITADPFSPPTAESHTRAPDTKPSERASETQSQASSSKKEKKKRNFTVPRFSCCICDTCGKSFQYKSFLKSHIQTHMDKKLYPCEICKKQYTSKFNYKEHKRTHTGQRHFNCNVCKRVFTRKSYLMRHQKIHINDEVYTCDVCDKQFTVRSYLVTHMRLHTGETHSCNICNKQFKMRSYLLSHKLTHKRARVYTCKVCDRRFQYKHNLDKHKCFANSKDMKILKSSVKRSSRSTPEEYILPSILPSSTRQVELIEIKIEPDP